MPIETSHLAVQLSPVKLIQSVKIVPGHITYDDMLKQINSEIDSYASLNSKLINSDEEEDCTSNDLVSLSSILNSILDIYSFLEQTHILNVNL